jgi:hypothetical protein
MVLAMLVFRWRLVMLGLLLAGKVLQVSLDQVKLKLSWLH